MIFKDSTLTPCDLKFINLQSDWSKNVTWETDLFQNIILEDKVDSLFSFSEVKIDSLFSWKGNILIVKMSIPVFDERKEKAYFKAVVRTSLSIIGNLITFKKDKNEWVVVDQIPF